MLRLQPDGVEKDEELKCEEELELDEKNIIELTVPTSPDIEERENQMTQKSPNELYILLYNFVGPFIVITVAAIVANLATLPFMFPSLGPTAFLHFAVPNKPTASPKSTLIGHFIGILMGSISLQIFGLYNNDAIFIEGTSINRIFASALSVALTCFSMILFHVEHPPAGATTLIISLGILKTPKQLISMMLAIIVLTVLAFIINRLCRNDVIYPIWSVPKQQKNQSTKPLQNQSTKSLRFDSFRFDEMDILDLMNDKFQKLNEMKDNLSVYNFVEYFNMTLELTDLWFKLIYRCNDLKEFNIRCND